MSMIGRAKPPNFAFGVAVSTFNYLAASRWRMIIGYARVATTEQNLGLRHDDRKAAFDASVD